VRPVDFETLTRKEVDAKAEEIEHRLREQCRRTGRPAATVTGTEDDDWLKLRALMEVVGARTLQDLEPQEASEWADRMARHSQ
jgi:hypothetical protein